MRGMLGEKIRDLAVFYILLMTFLNLVPTGKYEKYVRFFMGLLLIGLILLPVLSFLGGGRQMSADFFQAYTREERERTLQDMENLQEKYLTGGYEEVIREKIMENLKTDGIDAADVKVNIEGEKLAAKIFLKEETDEKSKRRVANELEQRWGISEDACQFLIGEDEYEPVGDTASSGTSAGGDGVSCIRQQAEKNKKRTW